jgi:hypothetical protein
MLFSSIAPESGEDRSALLNIEKLIRKGILKEATGKQRNRVFIAPQIVKIIEVPQAR